MVNGKPAKASTNVKVGDEIEILFGQKSVKVRVTAVSYTHQMCIRDSEDARHPKTVTFTGNLVEDLKRRDFTINAMAYNDTAGLVDAFDGIGDLKRHVIRCVGIPHDRFGEDALRDVYKRQM